MRRYRAPQFDAARQPVGVGYDRHVVRQSEIQILGIAAADIEMVEADNDAQYVDYFGDALVPRLLAFFRRASLPMYSS